MTTTTDQPTYTRVYLNIAYYVFQRHQEHLLFHDLKIVLLLLGNSIASTIFSGLNLTSLFVSSQKKLKYLTKDHPVKGTATYANWVASDCNMMTRLLSNMHEKVNVSIMFLKTAKEIWNTLKEMYSSEHNISCIAGLYESYSHCDRMIVLYLTPTLS